MRKRDELEKGCMAKAGDGEMTFVLLGRDPSAPYAIRQWIADRIRRGLNAPGDAKIVEAWQCAETMMREHPPFPESTSTQALDVALTRDVVEGNQVVCKYCGCANLKIRKRCRCCNAPVVREDDDVPAWRPENAAQSAPVDAPATNLAAEDVEADPRPKIDRGERGGDIAPVDPKSVLSDKEAAYYLGPQPEILPFLGMPVVIEQRAARSGDYVGSWVKAGIAIAPVEPARPDRLTDKRKCSACGKMVSAVRDWHWRALIAEHFNSSGERCRMSHATVTSHADTIDAQKKLNEGW